MVTFMLIGTDPLVLLPVYSWPCYHIYVNIYGNIFNDIYEPLMLMFVDNSINFFKS